MGVFAKIQSEFKVKLDDAWFVCLFVYVCGGQVRQLYSNEGSRYISSHALELLLTEQVGRQTEEQTFTPLPSTEHFQCLWPPVPISMSSSNVNPQGPTFSFRRTSVTRSSPCGEESSFTSAGPTAGLYLHKPWVLWVFTHKCVCKKM